MSSNRHLDVVRLAHPPPDAEGSVPPDRLGGLDDLLDQAMDFLDDPKQDAFKTDYDEMIDEDTEKILDFGDIVSMLKSRVKPQPTTFQKGKVPLETAEEVVEEDPILVASKTPGTSDVSSLLSSNDGGNKK